MATIYHNPRCSKSRQTLEILQAQGVEVEVVKYLETPPDADTLEQVLQQLGCEPADIMRRNEPEYKAAGLDNPALSRAEQIALMVANPKVIERPIVVAGNQAVVGRPPENVLTIL